MAIVKVLSRHSPTYASLFRYQLRYVLNDVKTERAEVYTQNLRSSTIDGYIDEFVENESFRRYPRLDQVYLYHEILAMSALENAPITKAMMKDLVAKYMELRGESGVILAAVHRDKDHVHAHFAVSALHYRTGKSFGMSKTQMRELKDKFQEYHRQKYPELTRSFPMHGRGERYPGPGRWHALRREQIIGQVRQCYAQSTSQQDFLAKLRDAGLHHYERNRDGIATGIEYGGQRFRFARLLEDGRQLADLPAERSEEEQALEAIRAVRERRHERDEKERDSEERER